MSEHENIPSPGTVLYDLSNNISACFASIFLPGLGQLKQGRFFAFFVQLLFFALVCLQYAGLGHIATIPHVFLIVYSVLDAAFWLGKPRLEASVRVANICVPIFIISLIFVQVFMSMQFLREAARKHQCPSSCKMLALAMHNYNDRYGTLPPAYTVDEDGYPMHSWRVLILPFLDGYEQLYEKIRLDEPWDSEHNGQFHDIDVHYLFLCSEVQAKKSIMRGFTELRKKGLCYRSVVIGKNTPFPGSGCVSLSDFDTSETILLVDRLVPVCWMDPNSEIRYEIAEKGINREYNGIGSVHHGAYASLCDGSIRFLHEDIDLDNLKNLLKIDRDAGVPTK